MPTQIMSLDGTWLLSPDPANVGRGESWWSAPQADAKPAKVPWIIQDAFPGYHGVAWYWREFACPAHPLADGRYLLRFWAVDYLADVWVNDTHVGGHEGGETPFMLDVTDIVKPGEANRVAVRVLNPTHEPIDGIVLVETPHRNKALPYGAGSAWDQGGIVDSVELLLAPAVRIDDLSARADAQSGVVWIEARLTSALAEATCVSLEFAIAPAASGETLAVACMEREVAPGETVVEAELRVAEPHLWDLGDPHLHRVTVRVTSGIGGEDERSVRVGFRDFRFADGAFRLNGRRLFLRCSHTGNACPVGLEFPLDPDILRRDLLNVKVMGFNAIRWIAGIPRPYQLDLCDEIGLMVYEESYAGWCMADSPKMAERFDRSTREMILRDRNHSSVTIWGLLNETPDGPVFRHAVEALSLVRSLDDSRMVLLASGRWDGQQSIGSICNPGSHEWEHLLGGEAPDAEPTQMLWGGYCDRAGDAHVYPRVPHTAEIIRFLRTFGEGAKPVLLSEYGVGSAVDLVRVTRHYEQLGAEYAEDARYYRSLLDRFLVDWERWGMARVFGRPEDYFAACLAKMAGQRLLGLNALRANPNLAGYSLTGTVDQGMTAEGLTTTFREFKPGTIDAMADGFAPLRWCLFAEPVSLYRGGTVRLEAVLANEDALRPGEYPALFQVFDPMGRPVLERHATVTIPEAPECALPLAIPVFAEEVALDGPSGAYRFVATFERGAAAAGGEAVFYLVDAAEMPPVTGEVLLWGDDPELATWLGQSGIRCAAFTPEAAAGAVIVASGTPPAPGGAEAFAPLVAAIDAGATVIFLTPGILAEGDDPVAHLPLESRGQLFPLNGWLYLKDEWTARHPVFEGLPCGGLMDYTFYREIIPDLVWNAQDRVPDEIIAGAMKTSQDYIAGLMLAAFNCGKGRIILNTLLIRENLGTHPVAERLLRNMLRWANPPPS